MQSSVADFMITATNNQIKSTKGKDNKIRCNTTKGLSNERVRSKYQNSIRNKLSMQIEQMKIFEKKRSKNEGIT